MCSVQCAVCTCHGQLASSAEVDLKKLMYVTYLLIIFTYYTYLLNFFKFINIAWYNTISKQTLLTSCTKWNYIYYFLITKLNLTIIVTEEDCALKDIFEALSWLPAQTGQTSCSVQLFPIIAARSHDRFIGILSRFIGILSPFK